MHPGASSINSISLWMFSCQKSQGYKEKGEHASESRQVLSLINDPCFGFCIPQVQRLKHRVIVNLVQMTDEHSTNASVTCTALLFPFLFELKFQTNQSQKHIHVHGNQSRSNRREMTINFNCNESRSFRF